MFADDKDLLRLAPTLFRDAAWLGQRLYRGTVTITGAQLVAPLDVNFFALGVRAGGVVVVAGASYEITTVSGNRLNISRPRVSANDPIIPPTPATGVEALIPTFRPQIAAVEPSVLREAGLSATGEQVKVLNASELTEVVALRAVILVLLIAGEGRTGTDWERARLAHFSELERRATRSVSLLVDTNGDGQADEIRALGVLRLVRI